MCLHIKDYRMYFSRVFLPNYCVYSSYNLVPNPGHFVHVRKVSERDPGIVWSDNHKISSIWSL